MHFPHLMVNVNGKSAKERSETKNKNQALIFQVLIFLLFLTLL